jgi:type II secretory pathway pseudopilin PulG
MIVLHTRRAQRLAMTLIEMVVVLVILTALAGLLVPALGGLKGQSDDAASAAGSADVMSNLETYKAQIGAYPLGMDSLLDGSGAVIGTLWQHAGGGPATPTPVAGTLPAGSGYAQSLGHMLGTDSSGDTYVYDHDTSATDPSASGTIKRSLEFDETDKLALVTNTALVKAAGFPSGTLPADTTLVAFGIGPSCSAVGKTMAGAPRCSAVDNTKYGRYIAIFALYSNGRAGTLRTVVDAQRQTVDSKIKSYRQGAPSQG